MWGEKARAGAKAVTFWVTPQRPGITKGLKQGAGNSTQIADAGGSDVISCCSPRSAVVGSWNEEPRQGQNPCTPENLRGGPST